MFSKSSWWLSPVTNWFTELYTLSKHSVILQLLQRSIFDTFPIIHQDQAHFGIWAWASPQKHNQSIACYLFLCIFLKHVFNIFLQEGDQMLKEFSINILLNSTTKICFYGLFLIFNPPFIPFPLQTSHHPILKFTS